ncbi:hypothetical protein [uncultured Hyphomicrobium sp.]|uniref:hypothetical protein n=1 Tax=uncultured Hyphomicrobium sp. TaxID=194373 RepID=UPI0025D1D761|nr:hypothetical protein [uncultured Hyphomicrobium sp.]
MQNSGETDAGANALPGPADEPAAPGDSIVGDVLPEAGIHADSVLGDSILAGDDAGDLSDLHAALASLSSDTFAYLDIALDHLTSSSDLFDVPGMNVDDLPDAGDVSPS